MVASAVGIPLAVQYATLALQLAPMAIQAGLGVAAMAREVVMVLRRPDGPSEADFDALRTMRKDILAKMAAQVAADTAALDIGGADPTPKDAA